ncbi:dUTP diphosphatase-like protein [Leptotrombidium deliense]|uniref:Deoxyuridine 5'-triphosphate nucleotidohydrolase n=1 Tax=Leptotrombidium deliense TaxID=299467 RepID=A0A443SJV6_9ACAR|nr:dUTP diphosphatase-like protein [Leptotrombidium deliense]
MSILYAKKLSERAIIPTRATTYSAGFDLYSPEEYYITKHGKVLINTHIAVSIPESCYGRIAPRSCMAWNMYLDVGGGVIDSDYRGAVFVILYNFSDTDYIIRRGDKIAQLICEKIELPKLQVVLFLSQSERGINGFGSSD